MRCFYLLIIHRFKVCRWRSEAAAAPLHGAACSGYLKALGDDYLQEVGQTCTDTVRRESIWSKYNSEIISPTVGTGNANIVHIYNIFYNRAKINTRPAHFTRIHRGATLTTQTTCCSTEKGNMCAVQNVCVHACVRGNPFMNMRMSMLDSCYKKNLKVLPGQIKDQRQSL